MTIEANKAANNLNKFTAKKIIKKWSKIPRKLNKSGQKYADRVNTLAMLSINGICTMQKCHNQTVGIK